MDEGDGTLWLANASKLSCRFLPRGANEDGSLEVKEPEVLFFEEEDFEEEMRETESVIEQLGMNSMNALNTLPFLLQSSAVPFLLYECLCLCLSTPQGI